MQTGTEATPIYLDFEGELIRASIEHASLTISEFVHITGSIAFEKGGFETVKVTGGLLTGVTGGSWTALSHSASRCPMTLFQEFRGPEPARPSCRS